MEENKPKRDYLLPASILIAALLVSGAVIYNAGNKASNGNGLTARLAPGESGDAQGKPFDDAQGKQNPATNVKPVSDNDHILGDKNAPIKVIEFSDLECPFCKRFHPVMKQVIESYGGKVAWVYRHYPLDALHSKARKEAEATECAAELGGPSGSEKNNKTFWMFVDKIFAVTPSNDGLDVSILPKLATDMGLDKTKFETCLANGTYAEKVAEQLADAENSGGRGTPYSIVLSDNKVVATIPGALPFEQVKTIIDKAISN